MFDVLPVPNITAKDNGEKITQVVDFLFQFREELEFVLTGIISGDYGKLTAQPAQAVETVVVSSGESQLTVAEVINSAVFRAAIKGVKDSIPTKYLVSAEQMVVSEEVGGINFYVVTDADGNKETFQVRNGKAPEVSFQVNSETGNLDYEIT